MGLADSLRTVTKACGKTSDEIAAIEAEQVRLIRVYCRRWRLRQASVRYREKVRRARAA
jgi:hypothetical protein